MGNWQLEVVKMGIYIFTPVAAFYYFHQVEYFKEDLIRYQRKARSLTSTKNDELMKECQEKLRENKEAQFKEQLAKYEDMKK